MNKTIFVILALATVGFTGTAAATWECGSVNGVPFPVAVDSCGGDTNTDNPWAGCDGTWRDAYITQLGDPRVYAQVCVDDGANAWVCQNPDPVNPWNVNDPTCEAVQA